jgi:hypothetical protein
VAKGLVSFSLHFETWEGGKATYRWGTHACSECEILDAVNAKMGAFAAIYIDHTDGSDEATLVFADYTPVREETLELQSGVIPEGTLEITEAGKHDVARYAYADVKAVFEDPIINIADGKVTAEANGLKAEKQLETPRITFSTGKVIATANELRSESLIFLDEVAPRTHVTLTHSKEGIMRIQEFDRATNAIRYTDYDLSRLGSPHDLTLITGSTVQFTAPDNAGVELYDYSGTKPSKVGQHLDNLMFGFSHVFWVVSDAAEGASVALTLYVNPWS